MKKRVFFVFLIFSIICFNSFGQTSINPFSKEYQQLKMSGQIPQPQNVNFTGIYPELKYSGGKSGLLIPLDGSFSLALSANDDGYTALMNLPFSFTFYGDLLSEFYINNNGNISFGSPYSAYTPAGFPINDFPMIAPFWADVDTRGSGSGLVYYRIEPHRLVVIWDHVGYYSQHTDRLNTFELIITDGLDPLIGVGNNVAFCYDQMQWTTGDYSGGSGGFGGSPATAGINKGNGADFALIGRFDHEGSDYDGPGGNNDGVSYLDYKTYFFNTGVAFNNIPPLVQNFPATQPIQLLIGDTYNLTFQFIPPEVNQIVDVIVNVPPGLSGFTQSVTPGNLCNVTISLLATLSNVGNHTVQFIATDNGIPAASTTVTLTFNITNPLPNIAINPLSLSESLYPNETSTQILTISNTGEADLNFDLEDVETSKSLKIKSVKPSGNGDNPDDFIKYLNSRIKDGVKAVSWLSETPLNGVIPAGESIDIEVAFDATGLVADMYNAQILINSNDPDQPQLIVPVSLEVLGTSCVHFTTDDNENNLIQGTADYDLDNYLCNDSEIVPIEFNIFVQEEVIESAQLSLYAWDVDETGTEPGYPEVDNVFINGHLIGTLTGANSEFSTSVFNIDPSFLNPGPDGKNLVQVYVSVLGPYWCVQVDWGQLIINNCMGDNAYIRYVNLDKAIYLPAENVSITVEVDTYLPTQQVIIETNLLDENMVNVAGISNTRLVTLNEDEPLEVTLPIPNDALMGATYHAQVIVYDALTYLQEDLALVPFLIWDGNGLLNCMEPGWQLISSYLNPTNPDVEVVLQDLVTNEAFVIILNRDGFYWPSQNINLLDNWNVYSGYKIKMTKPDCLIIDGEMPVSKTVNLLTGVNYLPVLNDQNVVATDIFNQISGQMLFAFDILNGLVYWPAGGLYTLQTLEPGKGYLVSMTAAASVTYPETVKSGTANNNKIQVIENSPWTVENTGVGHIISIEKSALSYLNSGDIVAAFNSSGMCVGVTQFTTANENLSLVVYGDDFTTSAVDGMIENEPMTFKVYNASSKEVSEVTPVWNIAMPNADQFAENGLSAITSLKASTSIANHDLSYLRISPNPSNGLFNIIGINEAVMISVLNTTGQILDSFNADKAVEVDLSRYAKGIYYLKIVSGNSVRIEKVIVK